VKESYLRKNWLVEYESIKKEAGIRFGDEYVRNFTKIIAKIAQHHYKKNSMLLGKERELYAFLSEKGHNPFKIYRWCLLERIPEALRFQLKNGMINQKTALHMHFKNRHESENTVCVAIRVQGLNLVRSM
jgi:ribonucleotide reductase alpha subunit